MGRKMTITVRLDGEEPVVIEGARGILAMVREEDGVRKMLIGDLQLMDLALMIKAMSCGEGRENQKIRTAKALAGLVPDFRNDEMVDVTPQRDGLNDPFTELIRRE